MHERLGRRLDPVVPLLVAGAAVSTAVLLELGSKLTFLLDDWEFLLYRPGLTAHSVLDPHGEHISIAPILIYKALLATVGMDSSLPYLAVDVAFVVATAVLLFVYLRRRLDPWLALLAAALVLTLGPAYDDLLWDFQMGFTGSLACGLGAILMLERGHGRGDALACGLLTVGVTFSSLGLPFIVAAAVDVALRAHRLRRLYVVAVPALLYAVWWAGWGHTADTALSLHNVATTPEFVLDAAAGVFASLFGLVQTSAGVAAAQFDWGKPLLLAAVAIGAWRLRRIGRVPPALWIALALVGTFWILAGFNVKPGRGPTESRYLLPGVVFVLMIAGELLRGVRVPRVAVAIAYVVGVAALGSNVSELRDAYLAYRNTSDVIKADLGSVEIARDRIVSEILLDEAVADTAYVHVTSSAFLSATDRYGSPADDPAQIAAAPEPARVAADKVLGRALSIGLTPSHGPLRHCRRVPAPGGILRLPPGGLGIRSSPLAGAQLSLRRFATGSFPVVLPPLAPGETGALRIPTDRATEPWELALRSNGPAVVCG
ncbi:MAG: hypothetical protein WB771_11820 [Solirubrobacterales bacterium]